MTTPAEQEAERRYTPFASDWEHTAMMNDLQEAFIAGAEWSESRYRELLEAAREYREARIAFADCSLEVRVWPLVDDPMYQRVDVAKIRLLAAAAALEE